MGAFRNSVILVTLAFMLVQGEPVQELLYYRDCDEVCPTQPDAKCELRCLRIVDGKGEDCVNTFYKDNKRVFCYFL